MNPALLFLLRRSVANGLRERLRRLKNPRYLLPTILGLAYFAFLFSPWQPRPPGGPSQGGGAPPVSLLAWAITAFALISAAWTWVVPSRSPAIHFWESEVAILFPAPLTRKELIRFKLLDMQKHLLLTFLFFSIWSLCTSGPLRALMVLVGGWLSLNVFTLHQIGAKFTRQSLLEHGAGGFRRQILPILVIVAFLLVLVLGAPPLPRPVEGAGAREYLDALVGWLDALAASPAGWVLLPFRLLGAPAMAPDLGSFLARAAGLAAMTAALYFWVIRSDAAFEEAAAEHAEDLARRMEAAKKGRFLAEGERDKPARRALWRLGSEGTPEVAFVWKSVTETLRGVSPRLIGILAAAGVVGLLVSKEFRGGTGSVVALTLGSVMAGLAALLVWGGPSLLGSSLRQEMECVEALKSLPLSGARLVRASLAGTVFPTAVLQVLLVAAAAFLLPEPREGTLTLAWRVAGAAALMLLLPALTAISAAVDSAGVLYFPAWVRPGQAHVQGGVEGMGYGMVIAIGKTLLLALGCLVPGAAGALVVALGVFLAGPVAAPPAVILGAVVATGLVAFEIWIASLSLGRRFEWLDPAAEGLIQ